MIKAIIIDDEERAQRVLKELLLEVNEPVEVVAVCSNLPEGVIQINKHKPDVVFLDIEMPMHSGLEILDFFTEVTFEIVFVTAYSKFAIKAFEISAIDYLLKPIEAKKIELSLKKVKNKIQVNSASDRLKVLKTNFKEVSEKKIALPTEDGFIFVAIKTIAILEAEGSYTKVYLDNGNTILISQNLKKFEELLEGNKNFFRPHRSNILNLNLVDKYLKRESYITMEGGKSIPLSRDKKALFEDYIKNIRP